jgi:hypothetical protein
VFDNSENKDYKKSSEDKNIISKNKGGLSVGEVDNSDNKKGLSKVNVSKSDDRDYTEAGDDICLDQY